MDAVTPWLTERLLSGSLQGAGVIALVWVTTRLIPCIPATVQSALWWLAALKLLLAFAPMPALPIPVLPAGHWTSVAVTTPAIETRPAMAPGTHANSTLNGAALPWAEALIALWIAVVLIQAARLLKAYCALRAVIRRSTPWPEDDASVAEPLAELVGLRRLPRIATSDDISGPQVAGIVRPIVLLPQSVATLTAGERTMTICHELMHIRRRDLAFGWVPALAERLFFFHPLARLAAREYATSREAACDVAVVRALDLPPAEYGRLLVRLGIAAGSPVLVAGGSPPSMSSLRRRLQMLQHTDFPAPSHRSRWLIAAVVLALVPVQFVARTSAADATQVAAPRGTTAIESAPASPAAPVESAAASPATPVESAPRSASPAAPVERPFDAAAPREPANTAPQSVEPAPQTPADVELLRRMADQSLERQSRVEEFVRMQLEVADAQRRFEASMINRAPGTEQAQRDSVPMIEAIAEHTRQRRREAEVRAQQTAESSRREALLTTQLDALARQQDQLASRMIEMAMQQERLAEAQRELSQLAEQLRKALAAR